MMPLVWLFVGAACASVLFTVAVRALAPSLSRFERPRDHSAEATLPPRVGGVAIALAWCLTLVVAAGISGTPLYGWLHRLPLLPIMLSAVSVFAVGFIDDIRPLSVGTKITVETLAASGLVGAGIVITRVALPGAIIDVGWMSAIITVAWVLALTNAFNLIDGLDGLAAGLALIASFACIDIVLQRGDVATAALLVALAGALAGFLPFNFNPAKIFLGDCGSLFIGFVLALTSITGLPSDTPIVALSVPLLIFALPLLDVAVTVVRRAINMTPSDDGSRLDLVARLVRADREHIHHRLVASGLSHRAAVVLLYAVGAGLAALAVAVTAR